MTTGDMLKPEVRSETQASAAHRYWRGWSNDDDDDDIILIITTIENPALKLHLRPERLAAVVAVVDLDVVLVVEQC